MNCLELLDRYIIKIIIYLRPLLDHSKSSYYQSIIYSDPIDDFHLDLSYIHFCKKYALKDYYKLAEIIKTYQYLFGNENIKILPFNKQKFKKNNLGIDFLYNCELALDKLKKINIPEENINEKSSINVLIINIYINKFLKLFNISWIQGRNFKNYLFNKFKLHLFFKENFDIFDSENYKDIYLLEKKFKKIEDKIEKDYGKKIFYGNKAIISKSKKIKLIFILLKNFTLMIALKKIYIKSLFIISKLIKITDK